MTAHVLHRPGMSLVEAALREQGATRFYRSLSRAERRALPYNWPAWARPEQVEPPLDPADPWRDWLVMAGRGFGKTRCGGGQTQAWATKVHGCRIAMVGLTPDDARRVMVEGESGLLATSDPRKRPQWEPTKGLLTWPLVEGEPSRAFIYSAANPEELRGPQHHFYWWDEPGAAAYPSETYDMLQMGLRLGEQPRGLMTTTPRPIALLRRLLKMATTVVTRGSTYANSANLPAAFVRFVLGRYKGTSLGRQEIDGELLDETPGALWKRAMFDREGFRGFPLGFTADDLALVVVGVDPAAKSEEDSDLTGIVAAARIGGGMDARFVVLGDYSLRGSPDAWARKAVEVYDVHEANRIVGEVNNGGEMVEAVLRNVAPNRLPFKAVTASRGKRLRAEPIAALYEQGRVHHLGVFDDLEDQMCQWTTERDPSADEEGSDGKKRKRKSPDRMDALVWALTELSTGRALVTN